MFPPRSFEHVHNGEPFPHRTCLNCRNLVTGEYGQAGKLFTKIFFTTDKKEDRGFGPRGKKKQKKYFIKNTCWCMAVHLRHQILLFSIKVGANVNSTKINTYLCSASINVLSFVDFQVIK